MAGTGNQDRDVHEEGRPGHVLGIRARKALRNGHVQAREQLFPIWWQGAVRGKEVHRRGVEKIASVRATVRIADQFRAVEGIIVGEEGQVVGIPDKTEGVLDVSGDAGRVLEPFYEKGRPGVRLDEGVQRVSAHAPFGRRVDDPGRSVLVDLDDGDVRQVSRGRDDGLVHGPGPFRRADEQQIARPEALRRRLAGAEGEGQRPDCQALAGGGDAYSFHRWFITTRRYAFFVSSHCSFSAESASNEQKQARRP